MALIHTANVNYSSEKIAFANKLKSIISKDSVFFCIGTDKVIYDSLGPIIGHKLKQKAPYLNVYGTLKHPIMALNINKEFEIISHQHKGAQIIGIDASLSEDIEDINDVKFYEGPVRPGAGMGKQLTPVGNYKIIGIVDSKDNPGIRRGSIRLYHINLMADFIVDSILKSLEII